MHVRGIRDMMLILPIYIYGRRNWMSFGPWGYHTPHPRCPHTQYRAILHIDRSSPRHPYFVHSSGKRCMDSYAQVQCYFEHHQQLVVPWPTRGSCLCLFSSEWGGGGGSRQTMLELCPIWSCLRLLHLSSDKVSCENGVQILLWSKSKLWDRTSWPCPSNRWILRKF